jgi:hypothetical protein
MTSNATPMAIFTASAASDGAVLGLGGLLPVTRIVPATTMASERSHPKMKAAPLRTPPLDARTRRNAVSGIGSRVMTKPMSNRSRITRSPCDRSRLGHSERLVLVPTFAWERPPRLPAGGQSLLWRNLRTPTTTKTMAIAAKMNPPM